MPGDLIVGLAGALVGGVFGSFAGVLADRLPRGEDVVFARSRCRGCGRTLAPMELVPVLSWLALRGRCRGCGRRIGLAPLLFDLGGMAIGAGVALALA